MLHNYQNTIIRIMIRIFNSKPFRNTIKLARDRFTYGGASCPETRAWRKKG